MEVASHIPEPVKKYWPYALGGVVGLLLLSHFLRGSSSNNGNAAAMQAYYAANTAAGMQAQQAAASMQIAQDTLNANTQIASERNQTQYLLAQGAVAAQVGQAAGQLVTALQMPTIQAINSAAAADAIALQSAGGVAQMGMAVDAAMVKTASDNSAYVASAVNTADTTVGTAYAAAQQATVGQAYAAASVPIAQANAEATKQIGIANANAQVGVAQANASRPVYVNGGGAPAAAPSGGGGGSGSDWLKTAGEVASVVAAFL